MKSAHDYSKLEERLGRDALAKRLMVQTKYASKAFSRRTTWFHPENAYGIHSMLWFFLKVTGLYERGRLGFRDVQMTHHPIVLDDLPHSFEGFRILHLTDLHLDGDPELTEVVISKLESLRGSYDICAITGDYRFSMEGPFGESMSELERIVKRIDKPTFAVLGNHDYVEMVSDIEKMGVRVLLNEAVELEKDGEFLSLIGVDDPHLYQGDDLERAMRTVSNEHVKVLLVHSPEIYRDASEKGIDFLMCGHTHAGQVCLPGGIPVIVNARAPRRICRGSWNYGNLKGYTSRGTGGSGLAVRFFCPPEITIHSLHRYREGENA